MRMIDADKLIDEIKKGIEQDGNFESDAEHIIDFIELFAETHKE